MNYFLFAEHFTKTQFHVVILTTDILRTIDPRLLSMIATSYNYPAP